MLNSRRLVLAHFWLAFGTFGLALVLGAWQMLERSPLRPWISDPEWYSRSLTAHGTVMGYVMPTLVAMGFGYAISESALKQHPGCYEALPAATKAKIAANRSWMSKL